MVVLVLMLGAVSLRGQTPATQPNQAADLDLQVLLDRVRYSPGEIDGTAGFQHPEGRSSVCKIARAVRLGRRAGVPRGAWVGHDAGHREICHHRGGRSRAVRGRNSGRHDGKGRAAPPLIHVNS